MPRISSVPPRPATAPRGTPEPSRAYGATSEVAAPPERPAAVDVMEPRPLAPTGYEARYERGRYATLAEVGEARVEVKATHDFREPAFLAEAGKPLTVVAGPELFASAAKVDLVYRLPGDPEEHRVPISDGSRDMRTGALVCVPARIDVPDEASGTLRLSFETTSADGRKSSQWSPHYDAIILPKGGATVVFDDAWGESVHGRVQAGEKLQIAYDADRLREILGTDGGARMTACISFDGEPPLEVPLHIGGPDGAPQAGVAFLPAVRVPYDASRVTLWFKGEGDGKTGFDSDFGKNYSFEVALPRPDADPTWKKQVLRNRGFPGLTEDNFVAIGPSDGGYNCIAWSLGKRDEWVWPGTRVESFDALYAEQGYRPLDEIDLSPEPGVEKIALYGHKRRLGGRAEIEVTHAARNDAEGRWMSKLGTEPLIRHDDAASVSGPSYGEIVRVYARPRREEA